MIGDLLLPPEPTDSSRAGCRDIARRLEEWQGPGIVVLCGHLVAPGCPASVAPADVLGAHPELTAALQRVRGARRLAGRRRHGRGGARSRPGPRPREVRAPGAGRDRPGLRDGRRHPHRARARRLRATRRHPADRRRTVRGPAVAGRDGTARRPEGGTALRHLAAALPQAAAFPVGATAHPGRRRAAAAGRLRDRRPRPHLPLTAPAERPATRLCGDVVLPLHRDGRRRRRPAGGAGPRGGHHLPRHLAGARGRRAAGAVGGGRPGRAPDRACPARDRRTGCPRRHPRRRRGGRVGRHRRRGPRARADPPRRRLLRLPGRHVRGGPRAPGTAGAPPDLPPPPPGVHPRDRDRRGPARPPPAGRCRPAHGHHGRAPRDLGHRHQGPLQGGRRARRAGRRLAERRLVAARARGGGGPHPGAAHPTPRGRLPLRGRARSTCCPRSRLPCGPTSTSLRRTCPSPWCRRRGR